jgi:PAS domain S-box-containing protein
VTTRTSDVSVKVVHFFIDAQFITAEGEWIFDLKTEELFCSDVMVAMSANEVPGTKCLLFPEDKPLVKEAINPPEDPEVNLDLEFRIITTFGEIHKVKGKGTFLISANNEFSSQINEHYADQCLGQIEKDMLADEQSIELDAYQFSSQVSSSGVWYINSSTFECFYSDGVYRMFGLPSQSLNAHLHTFTSFIHADEKEIVSETLERSFRDRAPIHLEYRILTLDLQMKYVSLTTRWTYNNRGEKVLIGVFQDISEGRHLEINLSDKLDETRISKILLEQDEQLTRTANWQINILTRQFRYSDNLYKIYGIKPPIALNLKLLAANVHPDDQHLVNEAVDKMFSEHVAPDIHFRIVRPDGKIRYLRQQGKAIVNGRNEMILIGSTHDITEYVIKDRKIETAAKTIDRLKNALSKLEDIAGIGYWQWDLETGESNWSLGIYTLLGYKNNTVPLSQKLLLSFVHPDDRKEFSAKINFVVNKQSEVAFSFRLMSKGESRLIKAHFKVEISDEKKLFVGILKDVTESESTKNELFRQVQIAEMMGDASVDMIMITDSGHTVISWNRKCEEIFGIKKEKAIGKNIFDIIPSFNRPEIIKHFHQSINGSEIVLQEQRDLVGKGIYNIIHKPIKNEVSEVVGVLSIFTEITKEFELRQQLTERLQFIEELLEATIDRIIVLDRNMNYRYWNKRAEDYYGIKKEDVINRNILELFPGFINDPSFANLRQTLKGETVHISAKNNLENKKGYFETYFIPVKNNEGVVTGVLWIVHDLMKEYKLMQEQRRAGYILDTINEMYIELDYHGILKYVNRQAAEMWQKRREDLIGKYIWDVFPHAVNSGGYHIIQKALEENRRVHGEYYSVVLQRSLYMSAVPVNEGLIVIFHDITDVDEARARLQQERHRLIQAQAIGHIGSFEWKASDNSIYWSDEMYRIHGFDPQSEEITIDEMIGFIHPADRELYSTKFKKYQQTAGVDSCITRIIRQDGVIRYLMRHFESFADAEGIVKYLSGTAQDITEQIVAEEELKNTNNLLQQTAEATPDSITIYDLKEQQPIYLNSCLAEWLDYTNEELIQMGAEGRLKLVNIEDRERLLAFNNSVMKADDGEIRIIEYRIITKDQRELWIKNRSKVFSRDEEGKVEKILSVLQEVTARKKIEEQVIETAERLTHLNETIEQKRKK